MIEGGENSGKFQHGMIVNQRVKQIKLIRTHDVRTILFERNSDVICKTSRFRGETITKPSFVPADG
jgi:hypothetical protein